jgi:hypothetical protein
MASIGKEKDNGYKKNKMNEECATIRADKYVSLSYFLRFLSICQETLLIGGREMYIQNFPEETCYRSEKEIG